MKRYALATIREWNIQGFKRKVPEFPGEWRLYTQPKDLNVDELKDFSPRYMFFPHWSWIVPADIVESFECVCFHMTDLPYGRGGSPLQNLIARGHDKTMMSAFRMTRGLDDGPIYLKRPLSLEGRAQEIFERGAEIVFEMIREIVSREPQPEPQSGKAVTFKRRTPDMSELPQGATERQVYDHIRMLDAEEYPSAFIKTNGFRFEFTHASLNEEGVRARVSIREVVKDTVDE